MTSSSDLLICTACGTQFPTSDRASLTTCFICDDPRQYTPGAGQSFTTLAAIRASHANEFHPVPDDSRLVSITTTPKLAIGQRAILIRTPAGNILWDCLTLLDDATVAEIKRLGGLHGIVISHPHYYSTHVDWAEEFGCPVYLSVEDRKWTARSSERQVFLDRVETSIQVEGVDTGIKAIKLGGHFPGSLVLLYDNHLLVADTLMITPAGLANWDVNALGEPRARPPGVNTFAFMFSIPNMIPLSPDEIISMWEVLKDYEFDRAHGAFVGQEVRGSGVKARVLESMQIQIRHMGWQKHPFLHTLW
ncbi:beta-lactamase-like protein [Podospora conica]|nr:beta-lactamase-like protein [Schizothecium conicum]